MDQIQGRQALSPDPYLATTQWKRIRELILASSSYSRWGRLYASTTLRWGGLWPFSVSCSCRFHTLSFLCTPGTIFKSNARIRFKTKADCRHPFCFIQVILFVGLEASHKSGTDWLGAPLAFTVEQNHLLPSVIFMLLSAWKNNGQWFYILINRIF